MKKFLVNVFANTLFVLTQILKYMVFVIVLHLAFYLFCWMITWVNPISFKDIASNGVYHVFHGFYSIVVLFVSAFILQKIDS